MPANSPSPSVRAAATPKSLPPQPVDPFFPKPVQLQAIRRLVLDPGHGGDNLGAVGVLGVREKALALDVARRVAEYVRQHSSVEVVLTRDGDQSVPLRQRPRLANEFRGDAFISIHANAHETSDAWGMEVFFLAAGSSIQATRELIEREEGIEPAQPTAALPWSIESIVAEMGHAAAHARSESFAVALAAGLQKARPGVRFRGVRQAPFGVLKEARMPAVVLELGYLTHAAEGRALLDPAVHRQFGQAVLLGLVGLDRVLAADRRPVTPARAAAVGPGAHAGLAR